MMKTAKLGCGGPGAGQEQASSKQGTRQGQGRSRSRAERGQDRSWPGLGRSKAGVWQEHKTEDGTGTEQEQVRSSGRARAG